MTASHEHNDPDPHEEEGSDMFGKRPNDPVPSHRKSWKSFTEGYDIYCASSWRKVGSLGEWVCGYCQQTSTDPLSPTQHDTLADCRRCGRTNRISL
ncbi:hypothetical protein FH608_024075 [Nonomuraea phyllanthi]|uniref:Uncharacterized protein n=1 Tax=Nonomuraea phyllanthi TaxID=2219224 RepID=A0A5C4W8Z0_9ACTN|nr:hypothetical protein [Nonomuraea phyllanthi]KAB8192582.1 hypothetical protein FH608_024075 [Nonomuraea phyllanthi]QFY08059.1 hypothetical protein GBF35_16460 [Nonomuraea phyllanthi]